MGITHFFIVVTPRNAISGNNQRQVKHWEVGFRAVVTTRTLLTVTSHTDLCLTGSFFTMAGTQERCVVSYSCKRNMLVYQSLVYITKNLIDFYITVVRYPSVLPYKNSQIIACTLHLYSNNFREYLALIYLCA